MQHFNVVIDDFIHGTWIISPILHIYTHVKLLEHCMLLRQDVLKHVTYYSNECNALRESKRHNKGSFQFLTLQTIE